MAARKPKLKRDWVGRRVQTLIELRNGWGVIPAGTVLMVDRNHAGLALISDPCDHCGLAVSIRRVPESAVELLPEED